MDRRNFLKTAAVGASAGALSAPAVLAQDRQVVRMVTTWPRNFPALGTGAQRLADRITAASGGRLEVKLFAAGELVPPLESFDAVATGSAEMYHAPDYYFQGKHRAFNFFTAVPMGLTCQEMNAWIHFGGGQALWDELSAQFGVKAVLTGNTGVQTGGWFRNPITSLDDMKGLKMRIPGLGGEVIRQIGGTAVALAPGEIFAALQSGAIDAAEFVGPLNDLAFGFHNVLKNYLYPAFQEPGAALALGMNKGWWDGLDAADQALIAACAEAENGMMMAEFTARNGDALNQLMNDHGVTLFELPPEVFAEVARASEGVVAAVAEVDDLSRRIFDSYHGFRASVAPWTRRSEQAYTLARHASLDI